MAEGFRWQRRHTVLAILFATWIISFVDRIAISVAIPYIAEDYGLSPVAMGVVLSAFFGGYSLMQIPGGLLADRFGVRKVASLAMIFWSVMTAVTGAATNLTQMVAARFLFGLGEGLFPACAFKSIAVWFPREERARANAIMLASNSVGAAIAPLIAVAIISVWGWQGVFYALAVPGFLMVAIFWRFVRDSPDDLNPQASAAGPNSTETAAVDSDVKKPGMLSALKEPNVATYFLILLSFNITLWGFTTWLPTYLVQARGFSMVQMGVAASLPFVAGSFGGIVGAWLSDRYFADNRRVPIMGAQLITALLLYLTYTSTSSAALLVWQTLAGFSIKFFIGVFWALPMNTVTEKSMGVASGFINMGGQIAAFISPLIIGYLIHLAGGGFGLTFALLIGAPLVSFAIVLVLPKKIQPWTDRPASA